MKTYLLAACLLSLAAGCGNDLGDTTTDAGTGPAPLDRDSGAAAPTEDSSPGTPYDSSPPDSGSALAEAAAPDTGTGGGGTTLTTADSGVAGEGGTDGGVAAEAGAGPWSFNYAGSVSGLAFNPIDGIGYFNTTLSGAEADAGVQTEFVAVFSTSASLCATGIVRQDETVFTIALLSSAATLQPGTYTEAQVEAPGQADVSVSALGATCSSAGLDYGSASGTVVITSVSAGSVSGTFSVTLLEGAGALTGSFTVPVCGQSPSTTCQP